MYWVYFSPGRLKRGERGRAPMVPHIVKNVPRNVSAADVWTTFKTKAAAMKALRRHGY